MKSASRVVRTLLFCLTLGLAAQSTRPAQAQTPTPAPQWKIAFTNFSGNVLPLGKSFGPGTPSSYMGETPPAGLNHLGYHGAKITPSSQITSTPCDVGASDVHIKATLTWVGSGPAPTTVTIQEGISAVVRVDGPLSGIPEGGYGDAIEYVAELPGMNVTPTTNVSEESISKMCTTTVTTTLSVPSDGVVTLPCRRIQSNIKVNYVPSNSPPDKYFLNWDYNVSVYPYY